MFKQNLLIKKILTTKNPYEKDLNLFHTGFNVFVQQSTKTNVFNLFTYSFNTYKSSSANFSRSSTVDDFTADLIVISG